MAEHTLEIRTSELKHLVFGTMAFAGPATTLGNMRPETAFAQVAGYPHTIAQLVAHMHFWQQWLIAQASGNHRPLGDDFKLGVTDFPEVNQDGWNELLAAFLRSFDELLEIASNPGQIPATAFANRSFASELTTISLHNACHLGQIVVLRNLLGDWTKPELPLP